MADMVVSAFLIGLLAVVAAAALGMSWSQKPDPKLVFLAGLMRKSPRQSSGTRPPSLIHQTKCPY
jgi:hypothetical protein